MTARRPVLSLRPAAVAWAHRWWSDVGLGEGSSGAPVVALVPSSNMHIKRWPVDHWVRLADALTMAGCLPSEVHSWYLSWLLPPLAVRLFAVRWFPFLSPVPALAWLLFTGLVVLPYVTYDTHEWQLWLSHAQYVPLLALLLAGVLGPIVLRHLRPFRTAPAGRSNAGQTVPGQF
ncbi:MAG TPA: hypothetical protein VGW38_18305 [Chloroflexota bacterium]|nr:hypothetical protein [Chloroflexota bacterium]